MRHKTLGTCTLLWALGGACKPQDPIDATSTGEAGTSTTAETATTAAEGKCGADGILFKEICFRRHDIAEISADHIQAADFNADGRPDLLLDNGPTRELRVLYWNGPDDFQLSAASQRNGGVGSYIQVFAADMDGDKDIDVGILDNTMEVIPFSQGQPGTAEKVSFGDMNTGYGVVFDSDGDSRAEVFIDTFPGVQLWRRMGDTYVAQGMSYSVPDCGYLAAIVSADFNADGLTDVAMFGADTCGGKDLNTLPPSEGRVLLANPDQTFTESDRIYAGTVPERAYSGDFDGDGVIDLAVMNTDSKDVSILIGAGDGTFEADVRHRPGIRPSYLGIGDLDGDGMDELVTVGAGQGLVTSEPYLVSSASLLLSDVFGPVAVADLNQDGLDDVAARSSDGSNHLILLISEAP